MRIAALIAAMTLTAPAFAGASDPVEPPQTNAEPAKPKKPKRVCRTDESQSATRIGSGRICKTEQEWVEWDADPANRASGARATRSVTAE